jgi:DNA-binding FrmR family transcriptional regulator
MIFMCYATYKQLHAERQAILRIQRQRYTDHLTEQVSQSLIDSGIVEGNGGGDKPPEPAGVR